MTFLDTTHKRKSAVITAVILLLLLYVVFNYGMKYLDPPIEYGVAVNFGNSEVGKGEPIKKNKTRAKQEQEQQTEQPKETTEDVPKNVSEDVITNDKAKETTVVENKKNKNPTPVKEKTPKKKVAPKPSKATKDALNSLLKGNSSDGSTKGEGDDDKSGVKGKRSGNPDSNKYYGNTRSGSGGNYNLAGRNALAKPIRKPNCEEEGTVVVSIFVNQNGKVIKAIPGARGTTNTAPCLLKAAKDAALATRWNADKKAPNQQKGTIIYKFSLSK